jgi:hypothetical protein
VKIVFVAILGKGNDKLQLYFTEIKQSN